MFSNSLDLLKQKSVFHAELIVNLWQIQKILIFLMPDLTEPLFSLLLMIEIKFHFLILVALPSVLHPWLKVRKHWFYAEILFFNSVCFSALNNSSSIRFILKSCSLISALLALNFSKAFIPSFR